MKELGSIEVTVTRITYGFDESDFEKEGVNEHCIKGERTVVKMDGEVYYDQYITNHLIMKRPLFGSPVDCFWNYIVQLFPINKPKCCGDAGCNGCKNLNLLRKRRFKFFNFKKQFLNIRLKEFFLSFKAAFRKKFGRFKQ
nr:MAG TPA: hypothetical protein [Caudoviricetes sp.]